MEVERTDLRGHEVDEDAGARRQVLLAQMADEVTTVVRRVTGQATHERAAAQMIASLVGRQLGQALTVERGLLPSGRCEAPRPRDRP